MKSPNPLIKKGRGHGVLTDEERVEVCSMVASFKRTSEIIDYLQKEKGKTIRSQSLTNMFYSKRWMPVIQQMRLQFTQGVIEEPLYNKRVRLQVLDRALTIAEQEGSAKDMTDIVDSAREEAEPRNDKFNVQFNQLNLISDQELIETIQNLETRVKARKEIIDAGGNGAQTNGGSKE